MTRQEHLKWAKERALEYVDVGDLANAVASMTSDIQKHDETAYTGEAAATLALLVHVATLDVMNGNARAVRQWVEGFT